MSSTRNRRALSVLVGAFVVLTVTSGLAFYNVAVYLSALTDDVGISVPLASAATAVFWVTFGLVGVLVGALLRRFDVRIVISGGAVAASTALLLLGQVREPWQLFAVYALFGIGYGASSLVPATTVVSQWFGARRAIALSIATTGLSVGGLVLTPLSATLIAREGLSVVTPWLALIYLLGVIPVTLLGIRARAEADDEVRHDEEKLQHAVRSRGFCLITAGFAFVMVAQIGGLTHLFRLVDGRIDTATASLAVSVAALSSVVGRLAGALVLAATSPLRLMMALAALQTVSVVLMAESGGTLGLLAGAVALGITVGNILVLVPVLLIERFGVGDYAPIYARSQLVATLGIAAGPIMVGILESASGSYRMPFLVLGIWSVFALATFAGLEITERRHDRRRAPAF